MRGIGDQLARIEDQVARVGFLTALAIDLDLEIDGGWVEGGRFVPDRSCWAISGGLSDIWYSKRLGRREKGNGLSDAVVRETNRRADGGALPAQGGPQGRARAGGRIASEPAWYKMGRSLPQTERAGQFLQRLLVCWLSGDWQKVDLKRPLQ